MFTENGEVEVPENAGEVNPVDPPAEQGTPPTAEEQMATLQNELSELRAKYEQTEKGFKTAQSTLTQKDRQLKEQQDLRGEIDSLKQMIKVIATARDVDGYDDTDDKKKVDVNAAFAELEQKQKAKEYQSKLQETINEYQKRVTELGLTEEDEAYYEIYKLVTTGDPVNFRIADIKLKKLEKEKTPVEEKKQNNEVSEVAELKKQLAEMEKKLRIASGELDAETGLPSGSPVSAETIRKNYRENPNDPKAYAEYEEYQKKARGLK